MNNIIILFNEQISFISSNRVTEILHPLILIISSGGIFEIPPILKIDLNTRIDFFKIFIFLSFVMLMPF